MIDECTEIGSPECLETWKEWFLNWLHLKAPMWGGEGTLKKLLMLRFHPWRFLIGRKVAWASIFSKRASQVIFNVWWRLHTTALKPVFVILGCHWKCKEQRLISNSSLIISPPCCSVLTSLSLPLYILEHYFIILVAHRRGTR